MRKQFSPTFKAQVVQEILKEEKEIAQLAAEYGVHPTQLGKWKALALHGLPSLFEERSEAGALKTAQKNLACHLDRDARLALVERDQPALPLSVQTNLLSLSRSSLYYRPRPPSLDEVAIKHRIDTLYTQDPFYGSRRIAAHLGRDGLVINRKAVQRHMREMGIAGIAPGPHLSRRDSEHRVYPYLLRDTPAAHPNHVWGIDVTYIRLHAGWLYLVAVLDWYSRYVISWELDQTLALPSVLAAVERALAQATPMIWNSDQGSHFTSTEYLHLLTAAGVQISMDGKERALDNVFVERLWRTVKYEEVYYASPREARQRLRAYVMFYNEARPHQALGYRTPTETYFAMAR